MIHQEVAPALDTWVGAVPLIRGQPVEEKEHPPVPWKVGMKESVLGRVRRLSWPHLCTLAIGLVALGKPLPFAGLEFSQQKNEEVGLYWQF